MMHKTLLVSAALAGSALAQAPVVTALLPLGNDGVRYVGSVISADASTTSMSVTCDLPATATGEAQYCQLGDKFGAKFAPSSLDFSMGMSETMAGQLVYALTMSAHCNYSNKETMTCTAVVSSTAGALGGEGSGSASTKVETTTEVLSQLESLLVPVTVTAGAERLTGGTPAATPTPTGSGSTGSTGQTAGNAVSTGTSSSTGGVPRMTQNAVIAGVAAIVGGVAML